MPLTVTSHFEDNFALLELKGKLTLSPALSTVREVAKQALNRPKLTGLILEVEGITVSDSSGLGELTLVSTLAANRGRKLRLVGVNPHLARMLHMTRIDELLPTASSIAEAKAAMS